MPTPPKKSQTPRQKAYDRVDGPTRIQSPDSKNRGFKKLQMLGTYADQDFSIDEVEAALPKDPQQRQSVLAAAASIEDNDLMHMAIDLWGAFEITHPRYQPPAEELYDKAGPLLKKTILALANLDETGENELNPTVESQAANLVKTVVDNARTMQSEGTDFDAANKVVHKVEGEWHYPIMTKYGYVPITKEGTGFVRSYTYVHPETNHEIKLNTGVNADYWSDKVNPSTTGKNYWSDLEPHLQAITNFKAQ